MPYVSKVTICSLCIDIDIPTLKYLSRYTGLNSIFDWITTTHSSVIRLFQKKAKQQRWGHGISRGIEWRNSMWKLQGSSKKEVKFPSVIKKFMWNFHGFLVGIGISEGCSKILWNSQRWGFAFSRISKGEVTNLISIGLCIYLYMYLYIHIYNYLSISISLSIYLSIYLPIYLSIYLSICLSLYLSIYLSIYIDRYRYRYIDIWQLTLHKICSKQCGFDLTNVNFYSLCSGETREIVWVLECYEQGFQWNSIFSVFKWSRVSCVYEFPKITPQF